MAARNTLLRVSVDPKTISQTRAMLRDVENAAAKVLTRSLNATTAKVRNKTLTKQRAFGILYDTRLDKDYVSSIVKGPKELASNRATFSRQEAKITTPYRAVRLARYVTSRIPNLGAAGSARSDGPIMVHIKPRGSARVVRGRSGDSQPFFVRLRRGNWPGGPGGKIGVFVTRPSGGKLQHLYGDSPSQILNRKRPALAKFGNDDLIDRIDKETAREIARIQRGFG